MDLAENFGLETIAGRDDASGNPLLDEGEEILQTFDDIQLILGSDSDQKSGKLFVTDGRIIWLSSSDTAVGFAAEFAAISMHAVATDPDSVDRPCLYVQLDIDDDAGQESSDEVEGSPLPELRFTPVDSSTLDAIFQAFCEGAERNPDAEAAEEGQGSLFFDQGEALAGAFEATEMSDDGEDIDRFGDAAEEDEGEEPYKTNGNTMT